MQIEANVGTPRPITLQRFLTAVVLICVAPLLILAAVLAADRVRESRNETTQVAERLAKNAAAAVDQHVSARIGALQMLAGSSLADDPADWGTLRADAQLLRESFGGQVVFADTEGRMRFHTGVPPRSPLPPLPQPQGRSAAQIAIRTGEPAAGDVFLGPIVKKPLVALAAPGVRQGRVDFVVLNVVSAEDFMQPLNRVSLPTGWRVSLLDSGQALVARRESAGPDGQVDYSSAHTKVVLTQAPWSVVVEVPAGEIDGPLVRASILLTLTVLTTAVVAVAGGLLASQRLARAVQSVAGPVSLPARRTRIKEVIDLQQVLHAAAQDRELAVATRLERDRKHAEAMAQSVADLQIREGQLRGIFESATDAIITCDATHRIVMANPAAAQMFRTTVEGLVGLPLARLVPDRFRARHDNAMEAFARTGATSRTMGVVGANLRALRLDGEEFPIDAGISHVQHAGHELFTVIIRDITERRRAERDMRRYHVELARSQRELRHLMAAQVQVQEEERKRIARELHDDLQQSIAAILLDAGTAKELLTADRPVVEPLLLNVTKLANAVLTSTRRIVEDLRPQVLEVLGLPTALETLAAAFANRMKIECEAMHDDFVAGLQFDDLQANCLYRVAQEALNNVAKHAHAQHVCLTLVRQGESSVRLSITDDGVGMNEGARVNRRSFGLLGMEERARAAGGTLSVTSSRGAGTTITVVLPISDTVSTAGGPVRAADPQDA
ncbi:MAG TPA: histidine kinase [Ideonella sp.]|uniref:PAS domain-containing sensor histidine kinase n=1 Tax=Ideonella sp. TaxID=1929293 RepID=UPI002E36120A|nr:histidine kinase [Ideonella sp.]HEX5687397.1 histidine kinase [Ideonella sp.]